MYVVLFFCVGGMRYLGENMEVNNNDESTLNSDISNALSNYLQSRFPSINSSDFIIEREWIGIMGFTPDRNPLIGQLKRNGEYIAAGFSGHGMPYAFFAGKNITDMIVGRITEPLLPKYFTPERFNI
jgi:glycine/D-amino acid oxidase-like deaminating enzyme